MQVNIPPDSSLNLIYNVIREERVNFYGYTEIFTSNFYYQIDSNGLITPIGPLTFSQYSYILVVVQVKDNLNLAQPTDCN